MRRIVLLFLAGVATLGAVHLLLALVVPVSWGPAEKEVMIPRGASFHEIARRLKDAGVVRETTIFRAAARWKGLDSRIRHGTYAFPARLSALDVIEYLRQGKIIEQKVTIPEGFTSFQIADILAEKKFFPREEFLRAVKDPVVIRDMGIPTDFPSLEGVLFPDTYSIPKGAAPEEVIQMLVDRYKRVWAGLRERAKGLGLSEREVVTLASIIEKETGAESERALVSAVFRNRLARRIPLQSDPTVIYALLIEGRFNGNLTRRDLQHDSLYNTYRYPGLPPGPIANAGARSFEAVLSPARADHLYFVSRNDGTHHFSKTLREHNAAVDRYQRRGEGRG
ncbi:MAG: endolytic transglycosylase MltG [Nitrospirae bacterium]|nr:endolytic transglycosylase MltG [Nitrospirota bacterium]MBI3392452.1 endolytic transglycosylase MltG [Nitrospirota bacterium]